MYLLKVTKLCIQVLRWISSHFIQLKSRSNKPIPRHTDPSHFPSLCFYFSIILSCSLFLIYCYCIFGYRIRLWKQKGNENKNKKKKKKIYKTPQFYVTKQINRLHLLLILYFTLQKRKKKQ